ncbi:NADPH:quinone reductase-like Zn-dependent oxidoreductase [Pseudacidovorax intermedius]|uniref:NADPH:quinone reductase-like Zn-dependent oxidoreductase n=1 Tax=Pseudacidovorax intermedius TaxID=433924 RepID=A0A370FE73_9BURK|nr:zinc-binding alcohol dehydrogenase family protein [Pseudacidovorax intermedius]RDI24139.1 NADPH:quinone reductase-like Zn-dependent oxidoreductase [Pseudacidovorax intermedius]
MNAVSNPKVNGPARALRVEQKAADLASLQLAIVDQPPPTPAAGMAVVQVGAAAVNPSDVKATLGLMPKAVWPRTPGRDFAGTVIAGPSAWIGREVYGSGGDVGITRDGSHARYLLLPEAALRERPRNISMDEAGAVGVPFVTAYEGFRRSGMPQAGQVVLVLGANGKVGQAAAQLAAQAGAKVIAVQRRPGPFEGFACAPVDVIDASQEDVAARVLELTGGRGADVVYNTVGSAYFEAANKSMAKGATQIFIATHDRAVPFDIFAFYRGMHTYVGIDSLAMDCVASTAQLDAMREGFERGTLKPFPVARSFGLDEALQAYQQVLSGSTDRVVLRP